MFEECVYFNLATLARKLNKIWNVEFERLGLSASHGYLLFAIVENPKATQKDLSALMELDASTITRFIDALAAQGLVKKTSRGKGAIFAVTPEGKKAYRAVKKPMDGLYHSMQAHFGAVEFKAFVNDLRNAKHSFDGR